MGDFIQKMGTSNECLKLFKHIILGSYFFKKNIPDCESYIIEPNVDKNIENMIITYFLNSKIKLTNLICYNLNSHFTIKSIDNNKILNKIVKITDGDDSIPPLDTDDDEVVVGPGLHDLDP